MLRHTHRVPRLVLSFVLTMLFVFGTALPASADNSVSLTVNAGTRTASIANLTLTALNYSHSVQNQTGILALTADDSTGSGEGWNVTVQSSDFVYSGTAGGVDISASNFAITTANAPTMTAGQAIDGTNGPKVPVSGATGTLDSAHKVIQANIGYGLGTYSQNLDVNLTVPEQSRAGTYSGTLTVTIAAAP